MSHYGYLAHSELYHHGVKGMKWGVRKAIRKSITNRTARMVANRDFRNEAITRRGKLKADYETFKSKYERGDSGLSGKNYRSQARQYRKNIRAAKRDIYEMNNPWITPMEKEHYRRIKNPTGKRALKAVHDVQSAAELAAIQAAARYGLGKAKQAYDVHQVKKKYGMQ